jgi:hypothetical protein
VAAGSLCNVSWDIQERHLYSRTHFKLNRVAALADWCQLLMAWISIAPINLMLEIIILAAPA